MLYERFGRLRNAALLFLLVCLYALAPACCPASDSVTVSWNPSPGPGVVGYNVYYGGEASGSYTNQVPAGNTTSAIVSGLVAGVTYYFAATATDDTGLESDFSNEVTYSNPIAAPSQPPTLDALANLLLNENAGVQTISLYGITSGAASEIQTLTVTAASGNTALIPNPTVSYLSPNTTGSISFTPVPSASGSTTVTVTVNDGGASNNIVTRSFTVTVNPANQPPTLNALPNVACNRNAGVQTVSLAGITSGAASEMQTLTITAASGNTALIPNPTVSYLSPNTTGSLSFTPAPSASGSTTVTVNVNDGGTSDNIVTRSFTVTVNQPPMISAIPKRTTTAGTPTSAISFAIADAETPAANLTLAGNSSDPGLVQNAGIVFGGSGANRTVTVTPLPGKSGTASITVTTSDGLATASSTFQLSVKPTPPGNFHLAGP